MERSIAIERHHDRPRVGRTAAAVCGVLVAAVGLGVAELVAGFGGTWRSPIYDVGDRVIDRVPRAVKDRAIEWFGTNDKAALLLGIGVLLALYAAVVGIVAFRWRLAAGLAGVGAFGALGAWAALGRRGDTSIDVVTPSLVGAALAAVVLAVLVRASTVDQRTPAGASPAAVAARSVAGAFGDRRRFVAFCGGVVLVAVAAGAAGRRLGARFDAAASRARVVLPRALRPLPPIDPAAQAPVEGVSPFVTPNRNFYRIDINLTVPRLTAESWSLRIHGLVDREIEIDYEALLRHEVVERDITLACVSNEVGGRLVGTARWLGVRLADLLQDARVLPEADQIVGRSVDGYTCGFPVAALDGRDALVALGMNGEPLPLEHGFPARLIVPGLYGYVSATKWLTEIELARFDDFEQYWVRRGWDREAPIKMSSRIDTPRGLATVEAGTVPIAGVAWAQPVGVSAVQVRIDDGEWRDAQLAAEVDGSTWRQWSYRWGATPGRHSIAVRAIDNDGAIQIGDRTEPFPNGSTGWHQIVVIVREPSP